MDIIFILIILIIVIIIGVLVTILVVSQSSMISKMKSENEILLRELQVSSSQKIESSLANYGQLLMKVQQDASVSQDKNIEVLKSSIDKQIETSRIAMNTQVETMRTSVDRNIETMRSSVDKNIENMRSSMDKQMEDMRNTVDQKLQQTLDEKISQSFKTVSERLEQVYRGLGEMQSLAIGVGDLKKVLTNVKSRGILGEIQLSAILEQILSNEQYDKNVATRPGSSNRVEFAIKLPGDESGTVYLPIDAKFPGDTYANLVNAYEHGDEALIKDALKNLEYVIKKEAKDIRDKYIEPPHTTEFAILFLPFEGLYSEVVRRGLLETLQRDYKVTIAGPTTTAALLNSLQMGFKTLAIQRRSGEVWSILSAVKTEFDKFGVVLTKTQDRLQKANEELDTLIGVRTRQIQNKLRSVESLESPKTVSPYDNSDAVLESDSSAIFNNEPTSFDE